MNLLFKICSKTPIYYICDESIEIREKMSLKMIYQNKNTTSNWFLTSALSYQTKEGKSSFF